MARDGLTDKRWRYIYIYTVDPWALEKLETVNYLSCLWFNRVILFPGKWSRFRPRSKFRNCYGIQAAHLRFMVETRGNSITCSSIFQRDKPWMIGNPFHEIFSKERIYRSIERGAINKEFWEARKIVDREFWKRESRVFPSFIATHSWLSTPRCNNVAAQRDSLFTHHHKSEPREWAAGGGFGLRFEFDNRMVLPFLQKKKNSLQITLQFRTKISPTNAEKYLVLPSIVIVTKR